jgi:hypothetical protein
MGETMLKFFKLDKKGGEKANTAQDVSPNLM